MQPNETSDEIMEQLRENFAEALEELLTTPRYPGDYWSQAEWELPGKLRRGEKIDIPPKFLDLFIRVSQEFYMSTLHEKGKAQLSL